MRLPFNEAKATQAAAHLLRARRGVMNYQFLIKLLYLADREALIKWGRPITTDRYVSMEQGPVLSRIYSLMVGNPVPDGQGIWRRYIPVQTAYRVRLHEDPGNGELSPAEEKLLDQILKKHGGKDRRQIIRYLHTLPEWRDPETQGKKSIDLPIRDILAAGGRTAEEIAAIGEEREHIAIVKGLISSR